MHPGTAQDTLKRQKREPKRRQYFIERTPITLDFSLVVLMILFVIEIFVIIAAITAVIAKVLVVHLAHVLEQITGGKLLREKKRAQRETRENRLVSAKDPHLKGAI